MSELRKRITDFVLRGNFDESCNLVTDDSIATWRVTANQIFNFIRSKLYSARTITGSGDAILSSDTLILLNPTSESFTQNLPACASLPIGFVCTFKNIALPSNGNIATLSADGSELIDDANELPLNSYPAMDSVKLYNTGTKWLIIQ